MIMAKHHDKYGYIYHSTNKISKIIIENKPDHINLCHKPFEDQKFVKNEIKPYPYQEDIIKLYQEYYKLNDNAVLSMPCGTGKTLIGYNIGLDIIK